MDYETNKDEAITVDTTVTNESESTDGSPLPSVENSEEMIPVTTEEGNIINLELLSHDALQKLLMQIEPNTIAIANTNSNSNVNASQEVDELSALLKSWNQEELIQHFKDEEVDINVLKKIECHHLPQLLRPFKYTTLISFENNLRMWRESIGKTLFLYTRSHFGLIDDGPSPSARSSPYPVSRPSSPPSSPSSYTCAVTLSTILNNNGNALSLAESYGETNKFNEKQRNQLISVIAQYFIMNKIHLELGGSYKLEKEIVERFPSEKLEYYRSGKRGKIYNKYCNLKFSLKAMNTSTSSKPKREGDVEMANEIEMVPEENADKCYQALKFDNLSSEEFDKCWKACSKSTLTDIKNSTATSDILKKWPQYKLPTGFRFLDMDFEYMFKKHNSLLERWENLYCKIRDFLTTEDRVKEKSIKDVLDKMECNNTPENCRDAALLWALHGYLVPTLKSVRKDRKGMKTTLKTTLKPTIKDSQESFVFVAASIQNVEDHIQHLQQKGDNVQPFIIVVGKDVINFKEIFLYFDGVKFPFISFIRAVDICFKTFFLFNLEFNNPSSNFWNFIQSLYFDDNKKCCTKAHILLNVINE
ncbi:uncharacterized protein LOC129912690 [Episyrphus balteatus]|uniref:uncharacterized protein LOC129912690 n=1 Tax=Episyrphus balteatus TaxID=286459 RepID=UPI0024868CC9|nr:uncharacterized protein LOC129912690 [Episyrphus balteatus]